MWDISTWYIQHKWHGIYCNLEYISFTCWFQLFVTSLITSQDIIKLSFVWLTWHTGWGFFLFRCHEWKWWAGRLWWRSYGTRGWGLFWIRFVLHIDLMRDKETMRLGNNQWQKVRTGVEELLVCSGDRTDKLSQPTDIIFFFRRVGHLSKMVRNSVVNTSKSSSERLASM